MQFDNSKFKKIHGYEEGRDVLDAASLGVAADYKKNVLKNFTAIDQTQITDRFRDGEYFVTRKYDGEYAIIFYQDGQTVTVNRSGRTRRGIPCIEEAGRLIAATGIRQGIFPAEIWVEAEYKTRVNDLISALAHEEKINTLRLAVFDILEIDNQPYRQGDYAQTWNRLHDIFGGGKLCREVDFRQARNGGDILDIWRNWVDRENSEGLIVHTRTLMSYKIKPRHYFDAVVIAYGEGSGVEVGQVRRLLFSFMPGPHQYLIMSRVGSGLNEKLRKELFQFFRGKEVPNPVMGVNPKWNDLVFVHPELVIEVAVEEVVTELASGEKTNYVLSFDGDSYRMEGIVPGYRTYTPVFIRLREDKNADEHDAGTGQVEQYLTAQRGEPPKPPKNEVLFRDVLTKPGRKTSCNVFIIWRTGKEYALYISSTSGKTIRRELEKSTQFYSLFNRYQKEVSQLLRKGYDRDTDKTITTHTCIEIMQEEYPEEYAENYSNN
ncbi:MAG: hypothetical protein LUF87_01905 [Alistipes sp.]|nr:hypothetical protein [Alistipes sp.]